MPRHSHLCFEILPAKPLSQLRMIALPGITDFRH
jgi:hypothetical protein